MESFRLAGDSLMLVSAGDAFGEHRRSLTHVRAVALNTRVPPFEF